MSRFPVSGLSAQRQSLPSRQRGIALVVALILLVVITLVGLAAVSGTIVQQKMSGNFYDREVAFQETEAAMRQAALAIEATTAAAPAGFFNCAASSGNVCLSNPFTDTGVPSSNINTLTTAQYQYGGFAASAPQYIVQYMGNFQTLPTVRQTSCPPGQYGCKTAPQTADFYRITARSGDPTVTNDRAYVLLQAMFRN